MDKQQITTWIEAAQQEVDRISREGTARRCIPVQPTDTDILLRDGAEMMAAALERIEALEAELEAALAVATQEVGVMHGRFHKGALTGEDVDKAIDWQDEFEALKGQLTELADKCEHAVKRLHEVLYG